jgi:hypothetical protein
VDELERARQKGPAYSAPTNLEPLVDRAAQIIREESEK